MIEVQGKLYDETVFIINSFSMGGGAEALLTQIVNNLNAQKYEIGIMEIIHGKVKNEPVNDNIKIYPYYTLADAPDRKERMYYVYHEWNKVIKNIFHRIMIYIYRLII